MAGALLAGGVQASTNLLTNGSFETPPTAGYNNGCGGGCVYSTGEAIPGWSITGGQTGQWIPDTYPGGFNYIPDGVTVGYSNGGTIDQVVSATAVAGTTYDLSAFVGSRLDGFYAAPTVQLLINGNVVATATGATPTSGAWSDWTTSYTATAGQAGQSIEVLLTAPGAQSDFDDVSLTAVPEPATWAMMILGMGAMGAALRRRRNAGLAAA